MDKLERLEKEFNEANDKKMQLQRDVEECAARLERAKKLIGCLGGERTRWTSDIGDLNNSKVQLVGDCLLAASFLSYAGAFTSDFRAGMIYDTFAKKVRRGVPLRLVSTARRRGWFLFC